MPVIPASPAKAFSSVKMNWCGNANICYFCGMIYDPLRRKYVADTPEERVRQGVIRWLHEVQGVSMGLMMSEHSFSWNGRQYRADIVVFDRELRPVMLVECKAPDVKLTDEVWMQALRYNRELDVQKIVLCNGRQMKVWERKDEK